MNLSFVFKHLNRRALNATSSTDNSTTFRSVAAVHLGKLLRGFAHVYSLTTLI